MGERSVTLLRVPLLHNCDFYDEKNNVLVYFTISESTFKRILNDLSNTLKGMEKQWVMKDLTRWELGELQNEAELDHMRLVFDKVVDNDISEKEIIYPKEFDVLYEQYLQTRPFVIDNQGRKWKVQKGSEVLTKEELMWIVYHCDYNLECYPSKVE